VEDGAVEESDFDSDFVSDLVSVAEEVDFEDALLLSDFPFFA
jgi:hypothetical protein